MKSRAHAAQLINVIDNVLRTAGCTYQDLRGVAVSAGPGSFTGLRIGLSTAKGICFGANLPLYLVPTFDAAALEIAEMIGAAKKSFAVISKVNTTEFYFAGYRIEDGTLVNDVAVTVLSSEEAQNRSDLFDFVVAPENWFAKKKYLNFLSLKPRFIAEWSLKNPASEISPDGIDLAEPMYLKEFVIKKKAAI
jgi:tRNA threonylcarbamoyladenosine biosynthesis protein TsaB